MNGAVQIKSDKFCIQCECTIIVYWHSFPTLLLENPNILERFQQDFQGQQVLQDQGFGNLWCLFVCFLTTMMTRDVTRSFLKKRNSWFGAIHAPLTYLSDFIPPLYSLRI